MGKHKNIISTFIIFIFTAIFIVGCTFNSKAEVTALKEIDISYLKDINFFNTAPEDRLLNKIFLIEDNSEEYIVFYKINIPKENVSFNVGNGILEINIITSNSSENTLVYKIIHPKDTDYHTIKLIIDGEEAGFSSFITVN